MIEVKGKAFDYGERIVVTLDDGKSFTGLLSGYCPMQDSVSGREEIEIDEPSAIRLLYVDEISEIETAK